MCETWCAGWPSHGWQAVCISQISICCSASRWIIVFHRLHSSKWVYPSVLWKFGLFSTRESGNGFHTTRASHRVSSNCSPSSGSSSHSYCKTPRLPSTLMSLPTLTTTNETHTFKECSSPSTLPRNCLWCRLENLCTWFCEAIVWEGLAPQRIGSNSWRGRI